MTDFDRDLAEIDRLLEDIRTGRYVAPPELVALAEEALARPDTRTPEQQLADGVRFVLGLGPENGNAPAASEEATGAGGVRNGVARAKTAYPVTVPPINPSEDPSE